MRLDVYLAENGYAESRERAKRLIEAGAVLVDGKMACKASQAVSVEPTISVREERFVSRGGEKLEAALRVFEIDVQGKTALDIGASTGGFTDCLLQHGAAHVVAVDAGTGQLHPRLAADARVRNIEKYNARELSVADVGVAELVVMDVSFISQTYILPRVPAVLRDGGTLITLIKPQFEAGRAALNRKGLVRNPRDRVRAVRRVLLSAAEEGLCCVGLAPSPIRGGDGNEEYLACFRAGKDCILNLEFPVEKTVLEGEVSLWPSKAWH